MVIPRIQDIIILKNGDSINGTVLTKTFSIQTVFGTAQVRQKDIAHVHMKGIHFNKDEIFTLEMNKFTGTVLDKEIEVRLQSGEAITLKKSKIHTIIMLTNRN